MELRGRCLGLSRELRPQDALGQGRYLNSSYQARRSLVAPVEVLEMAREVTAAAVLSCDGGEGCSGQERRVLPLTREAGGSNLILCRKHLRGEIEWRRCRNGELAEDCRYPLPAWEELEIYGAH